VTNSIRLATFSSKSIRSLWFRRIRSSQGSQPEAARRHNRTCIRYLRYEYQNLDASIAELRELAGGRYDILAEAAGITAGSWYAWPSTHVGHELVAAGMLIMAGGHDGKPLDYDELERWTRVGYERGMRSRKGER
jgi:hypothetical protein